MGHLGGLRRLSVRLRLRSWSHSLWVRAPHQALCWQFRAWSLLWILCLPVSLPLPRSCVLSLSLSKINKHSKKFFLMLIYFWERGRQTDRQTQNACRGGAEREGNRIQSRLQALNCQHRAWQGAWTHKPQDHDLSRSQMLNRLSHLSAPFFDISISPYNILPSTLWYSPCNAGCCSPKSDPGSRSCFSPSSLFG